MYIKIKWKLFLSLILKYHTLKGIFKKKFVVMNSPLSILSISLLTSNSSYINKQKHQSMEKLNAFNLKHSRKKNWMLNFTLKLWTTLISGNVKTFQTTKLSVN